MAINAKAVARTAISMNAHLTDGEKQKLLAGLRDEYSSNVHHEMPPGIVDADVAKLFAHDPVMGRMAQETLVMKDGPEKRRALKQMRKNLHRAHRELQRSRSRGQHKRQRLLDRRDAVNDVLAWLSKPIVLQRPEGSLLPKLREAYPDDAFYAATNLDETGEAAWFDLFGQAWGVASVFVVEHDWAAAFAKATDFAGGDFQLPAPICVFEFRVSGAPIVATVNQDETESGCIDISLIVRSKHGWVANGTVMILPSGEMFTRDEKDGPRAPLEDDDNAIALLRFLWGQIRAISIALDAEVAKAEIVRAPHRSNQPPRDRKPLPDYSYHVVSLARRAKAERAEIDPNAPAGTRKRLHIRRGHWRHYLESKTWIRWCLVGDPDLGFVDKHYKL